MALNTLIQFAGRKSSHCPCPERPRIEYIVITGVLLYILQFHWVKLILFCSGAIPLF